MTMAKKTGNFEKDLRSAVKSALGITISTKVIRPAVQKTPNQKVANAALTKMRSVPTPKMRTR